MACLDWSNPLADRDSFADVFINWQPQLDSGLNRNGQPVTDGRLKLSSVLPAIDADDEVCSIGKNRSRFTLPNFVLESPVPNGTMFSGK